MGRAPSYRSAECMPAYSWACTVTFGYCIYFLPRQSTRSKAPRHCRCCHNISSHSIDASFCFFLLVSGVDSCNNPTFVFLTGKKLAGTHRNKSCSWPRDAVSPPTVKPEKPGTENVELTTTSVPFDTRDLRGERRKFRRSSERALN